MAGRPLNRLRQLNKNIETLWTVLSSLRERYPHIDDCAPLPEDLALEDMTFRDHVHDGMGKLGLAHACLEEAKEVLLDELLAKHPDRREALLAASRPPERQAPSGTPDAELDADDEQSSPPEQVA